MYINLIQNGKGERNLLAAVCLRVFSSKEAAAAAAAASQRR
jgi:hypothetical protein